jgi:hypothetical protein
MKILHIFSIISIILVAGFDISSSKFTPYDLLNYSSNNLLMEGLPDDSESIDDFFLIIRE